MESYLKDLQTTKPVPLYKIHSSDSSISNKRLDLYLKGGVFTVTYKILVLDLLTKKLSPSIISGLIINCAHKAGSSGTKTGESFIAEIIRRGNQDAFIKAISEKPQGVGRGGIMGIEAFMKSLQVSQMLLYPRIKKSVKEALDAAEGLSVQQNSLKFTKKIEEIHSLLIELMQACIEEIQTIIKKVEGVDANYQEVLDVKKALLKSFHGQFRRAIGKRFAYLGNKAKTLLGNIADIRRLIWVLFNQDCVSFYVSLHNLRFNNMEEHFSLFNFCDEETSKLIERLYVLAKSRIFSVSLVP